MAYTPEEQRIIDAQLPSRPQEGDFVPGKGTLMPDGSYQQISSQDLQPVPSVDYKTPNPTPVYPVDKLDTTVPELEATEPEKMANDLTTQLQESYNRLLGQSSFRAEQEKLAGLPELNKTQTDLSSRLKAIQNEALAIPLQLQQQAEGRGITVGGLRPLESAALRNNAIQALGVSSLLEASRGNIATALDLVDRAVAQKYDPIKEEIATKKANLELILQSPAYSLADKKRAQKQKAAQDKILAQIEADEEKEKAKKAKLLEYAPVADAQTLREMEMAETDMEVMKIAAEKGLKTLAQQKTAAETAKLQSETAENLAKISGKGPEDVAKQQQTASSIAVANDLLSNPSMKTISGYWQGKFKLGSLAGGQAQLAINQFEQLKSQLALGARALIKGSGAISDYESRILSQSTSALGRNLSDEDFEQTVRNIRGVLLTNSGQQAEVEVTNPKTGQIITALASGSEIYDLIREGNLVEYK